MQQSENEEFEKIALYIFDDIIEFCGPSAAVYVSGFVPFVLKCAASDSILVRQPSCYGLGICAKFVDPAIFGPFAAGTVCPSASCEAVIVGLTEAARVLIASCVRQDAGEEMNLACTDNSVSSLGKVLQYQSQCVDINALVPIFFGFLPLAEDHTEGPSVYDFFCQLIEMYSSCESAASSLISVCRNHPGVIGENGCNLPKILHILATVNNSDFTNADISARMLVIAQQIVSQMLPSARNELVNSWPAETREKFVNWLK